MLSGSVVLVNGTIIVGAGPSGLAVAAGLKDRGALFLILEKADCIASLWQLRTYDRLKLHLPKQFYQLPGFHFPDRCPDYPTKTQFIDYLKSYSASSGIEPNFNESVVSAKYDEACRRWRVKSVSTTNGDEVEYICRTLVVASGEHAEPVVPEFDGLKEFEGDVIHTCDYKSGQKYKGKRVLVIGSGLSGMEVSIDLLNNHAFPFIVVRNPNHELPKEILESDIQVVPGVKSFGRTSAQLVENGKDLVIDSVIFATGYKSNVTAWLQESELFSENGMPKREYPNGWKGEAGLYAVGFTMRGLPGASVDATKISQDIADNWN